MMMSDGMVRGGEEVSNRMANAKCGKCERQVFEAQDKQVEGVVGQLIRLVCCKHCGAVVGVMGLQEELLVLLERIAEKLSVE
jgi:hypothetical protein